MERIKNILGLWVVHNERIMDKFDMDLVEYLGVRERIAKSWASKEDICGRGNGSLERRNKEFG